MLNEELVSYLYATLILIIMSESEDTGAEEDLSYDLKTQ